MGKQAANKKLHVLGLKTALLSCIQECSNVSAKRPWLQQVNGKDVKILRYIEGTDTHCCQVTHRYQSEQSLKMVTLSMTFAVHLATKCAQAMDVPGHTTGTGCRIKSGGTAGNKSEYS